VITPSYSTFNTAGNINLALVDLWATDPRALLKQYYSYTPSERIESYWSTLSTMDFLVSASDGAPHRIALYFADYENQGRLASLRVLDASNHNTLDFRPLPLYSNPLYLVYTYTGNVIFRVVNQHPGAPAAALSAFFWGGTGLPSGGPVADARRPAVSMTGQERHAGAAEGDLQLLADGARDVTLVRPLLHGFSGGRGGPQ
jgi:hypothetical protein